MANKYAIARVPRPDSKPGLKLRIENRLGILDPIAIHAYTSFGTSDAIRLRGRVVEHSELKGSPEEASTWRNVVDMIQRLQSDEIPGAVLRVSRDSQSWETTTDHEGFFVFDLDLEEPLSPGWHDVDIELVESVGRPADRVVTAKVLIPSPEAEFGVVSDLDDTVIKTNNTDFLQEMAILFSKGARQRSPFPGVPPLYRSLQRGLREDVENPIFYVSRSGWNLHDLFTEFMEVNGIPAGPLFLSDLRIIEKKSRVLGSDEHKFEATDLLLRTYSELPFILIGDSGMHDPELYAEIVRAYPDRILAVYIHDVSDDARDQEVAAIARKMLDSFGVPLVHGETTLDVAQHAFEAKFIDREGLDQVRDAVDSQD